MLCVENQLVEGRNGEGDINKNAIPIFPIKKIVTWNKKVVLVVEKDSSTDGVIGRLKEKMQSSFLFERNLRGKHIKNHGLTVSIKN